MKDGLFCILTIFASILYIIVIQLRANAEVKIYHLLITLIDLFKTKPTDTSCIRIPTVCGKDDR